MLFWDNHYTFDLNPFILSSLSSLSTSTTNTTLESSNSTTTDYTKIFPQLAENVSSMVNSIFFIIVYSILLICIIGFYAKSRRQMKRNQKILFLLVGICIIVQYLGLVWRLVYNGTGLHLNINYPNDYSKISNLDDYKIVLYVSSTIENALVLSQVINIIIVTCFIQNML